ncbi:MAG: phosphatidylglycerol lysyltransferase domain-containing protein [Gemmatimonadaceae bacterium]
MSAIHPDRERARELVLAFGWNTTAYQILNPGFQLWFSATHAAVVGYVRSVGRRVVGGAPVCAAEHLADVAQEFEHVAAEAGERAVYFGAEGRLDAAYQNSSTHAAILLGAQPVWRPSDWAPIVDGHASLRAQLNRARNKGVRVELWGSETAEHNAGLQKCLREWLGTRGLPPLHFLVEPETLGHLLDRRVFVASRGAKPVGFLVASPISARNGWLTEQFVRGRGAPNGTAELMIDAAVRWMAEQNADYVTLGLAPLSRRAGDSDEQSLWLKLAFRWVRAHGRRFYNFDGLDTFKAKFYPERWEPVYAIASERSFSLRSLYAIAAAFTEGHPIATVMRGLTDAARQELHWIRRRAQ